MLYILYQLTYTIKSYIRKYVGIWSKLVAYLQFEKGVMFFD
jgi:hypothetical protein